MRAGTKPAPMKNRYASRSWRSKAVCGWCESCQPDSLRKPAGFRQGGLRMVLMAPYPNSLRKPLKAFKGGLRIGTLNAHPNTRWAFPVVIPPTPACHGKHHYIVVSTPASTGSPCLTACLPRKTRSESRHGVHNPNRAPVQHRIGPCWLRHPK